MAAPSRDPVKNRGAIGARFPLPYRYAPSAGGRFPLRAAGHAGLGFLLFPENFIAANTLLNEIGRDCFGQADHGRFGGAIDKAVGYALY